MSNEEQQVTTTLKKVDSVEIDKEYNDKLKGILNEIREVKDIHMEFNTVLKSQEEQIDEIDKNVNMTSTNVDESNTNLIEVSGIQKSVFLEKKFLVNNMYSNCDSSCCGICWCKSGGCCRCWYSSIWNL